MIITEKLAPGISRITLGRPQQLNALTDAMMSELRSAITSIDSDASCRVLILSASGRGFCAGLDLKSNIEQHGHERSDAQAAARLQELYAGTIPMLRRLRQPIVAAINGVTVGAGLGLALAADIRIAGRAAAFHVGAVKMGLSAGECGISYHLPALIGAGRAFEIMLTGRPVGSEEAHRIGLVTELVDNEELDSATFRTAQAIAANACFSIEQTKRVMWLNSHASSLESALELENHVQILAMLRPDFREAVDAFVAKRPPVFHNA